MRARKVLAIGVLLAGVVTITGLASMSDEKSVVPQGDTEPPHLVSVAVQPEFVDTSLSSQLKKVPLHITDNQSGEHHITVFFARLSADGKPL